MNNQLTTKSIYLYTLPIILSELLEEFMILSDSILLSFKEPLYLSTVGIIDSIFLLFLAIGDSMNDSFQNYYSRHAKDASRCLGIFLKSIPLFACVGIGFSILCFLIPFLHPLFDDAHYETLVSITPYLAFFIFISFISLSLNSLLIGWGYTKFLGIVSLISVIINILLGFYLLYVFDAGINPCAIVLITSTIAEIFAIILMSSRVIYIYQKNVDCVKNDYHKSLIYKTLVSASVYPCLSDIGFHIGSIALYTYCLCFFHDTETALFTLFMSYWGMLQVPSQSFAETSINLFSKIYTKKLMPLYDALKRKILILSFLTTCVFALFIFSVDTYFYGISTFRILLLFLLLIIVGFNTYGEITEISLLVRLQNDSFMASKILYAAVLIICILVITQTEHVTVLVLLICFLIAQIFTCFYLGIRDYSLWHKSISKISK